MTKSDRQIDRRGWAFLTLLFLLVAFSVPYGILNGAALSPFGRLALWILMSLFSTVLLVSGTSAVASGRLWTIRFKILGPGAIFVVCLFSFAWLMPHPNTQVVRFFLEHNKRALAIEFSLDVRIPGMESIRKRGERGEAMVEVPSHLTQVDNVIVECNGYLLEDEGPYPIQNGVVKLVMTRVDQPPISPAALPSVQIFSNMPAAASVLKSKPKLRPEDVSLICKNSTKQNLKILMFDLYRHYKSIEDNIAGVSPWTVIPIEPRATEVTYNSFRVGTGWYGLVVRDSQGKDTSLGCFTLFEKELNRIEVIENEGVIKALFK